MAKLVTARESLKGKPLYHFTSFDIERFAQVVTESKVFLSEAKQFNDPFEMPARFGVDLSRAGENELPEVSNAAIDHYMSTRHRTMRPGTFGGGGVGGFNTSTLADTEHLVRVMGESAAELTRDGYRVFCLSTKLAAVLMWSHYAAKHRGVAFAFSSDGEFFGASRKVIYSDAPPNVDPRDSNPGIFDIASVLIKAKSWRHENEYRVVGSERGVAAGADVQITSSGFGTFSPSELRAVYVGCNMPAACVRAIKSELQRRKCKISLHQMIKVPNALRLRSHEVPLDR